MLYANMIFHIQISLKNINITRTTDKMYNPLHSLLFGTSENKRNITNYNNYNYYFL